MSSDTSRLNQVQSVVISSLLSFQLSCSFHVQLPTRHGMNMYELNGQPFGAFLLSNILNHHHYHPLILNPTSTSHHAF